MAVIPPELAKIKERVEKLAADYGLDFYQTIFEMLDWNELNMVAAYGGFPNRYPHWRFGMEYEKLSKSYEYGLSKIYEMVINNDPCYAYLLHSNTMMDQKLVMAHVYGHNDFFKNNFYFSHTNRKMMDEMANHKTRVLRLVDRIGYETVEAFVDSCLSLDNLIDYHAAAIKRQSPVFGEEDATVKKMQANRPYMDKYINPKEFLEEQQKKIEELAKKHKVFPQSPQKDVLGFLLEYAPLDGWEQDLLSIIREEAYYFAPQAMTKIMNEGWASY